MKWRRRGDDEGMKRGDKGIINMQKVCKVQGTLGESEHPCREMTGIHTVLRNAYLNNRSGYLMRHQNQFNW